MRLSVQGIWAPLIAAAIVLVTLSVQRVACADNPGFRMVDATGVDDILPFVEDDERASLYSTGYAGGAVCVGDVDGDGLADIYFSRQLGVNRLYLNQGNWKFEKRAGPFEDNEDSEGKEGLWGTGATLVDIDSDGDLDICQVNYGAPVQFFVNDGKANFSKVAGAFGLGVSDASLAVSFADVDNDGDLDAFVLCNTWFRPNGRPQDPPFEVRDGVARTKPEFEKFYTVVRSPLSGELELDEYGRRDHLFLNVGSRTEPKFQDVSKASGVDKTGFGLSCVWWDYDGDGLMDLSVSNDFLEPDRLFRNLGTRDGVPRFEDVVDRVFPMTAWSSMGSGIADINNDGLAELMTVDMAARSHFKSKLNMGEMMGQQRWVLENGWPRQMMRNQLYVNAGNGMFREEAWMRGLASTDWSWAVKWGDYDEDGWSDVFVTNGMTRNFTDSDHSAVIGPLEKALVGKTIWDLFRDQSAMHEANVVFKNKDGKKFQEVGKDWGLDLVGISYGAGSGDLDGDGDLDLVVTDLGKSLKIYENRMGSQSGQSNRLRVRLRGTESNAMGIGAKVTVTDSQSVSRVRWMMPWMGFQSQDEPVLHFGLGEAKPKTLSVVWPGGIEQRVEIPAGQTEVLVTESGALSKSKMAKSWWNVRALPWRHEEKPFDDFASQPLLPGKLSQPGPCFASGDLDGDGDLDAYLGGAAGQAGSLLVNFDGQFKVGGVDWGSGAKSEDAGAVWFDADGDGDLDLFVVSGSVEHPEGDELYRDRLYLNQSKNGNFGFEDATESLPDLRDSGSCVVAVDFDQDGDLDLFVGSRSVAGKYPLSPKSRLLRNESKGTEVRFVDATAEVAPGLLDAGLITDATWADLNGDQKPDLALAVEWGPVKIFWNGNENGKVSLRERDAEGMSRRTGWWQAIHAGDFDGDGDLDLLAGNVGWNTKYKHPTEEKPAEIYYGDMDNSGTSRIVEAKNSNDSLLPVRGRSCSTHAIPALGDKFKSYRQFASSDLLGIYGQRCLSDAKRFVATDLASGMWENDGSGGFTWQELPWEVQVSQVNDFAVGDVDGDGKTEVVVAQNEDAREPETGLWRGGLGVVMRYTDGEWDVVPSLTTGFVLKGAAQAIELFDVDRDGKQEVLVGQNGAQLLLFQGTAE